jgi:EpsI family protein
VTLPLGGAAGSIEVNEYLLQREGDLQIVYYWFFSQGEPEASEVGMKLDLVKNAIVRHRTDGAIVRVSAAVTGGRPATEARLQEFIHALGASLAEHLPA